jgi:acylphosphatase
VSPPPRRLVAIVRGQVQGVGFRWWVEREAADRGLTGWVANRADGSVECVAEGPEPVLTQLAGSLWEGPAGAAVTDVAVSYEPARGNLAGFSIRAGEHRGD